MRKVSLIRVDNVASDTQRVCTLVTRHPPQNCPKTRETQKPKTFYILPNPCYDNRL
jgi:hypothetical protein